jgi:LytS/YehU family sensor histidine kinase
MYLTSGALLGAPLISVFLIVMAGLHRVRICMRLDLVDALPPIYRPRRGLPAPPIDLDT